MLLDMIPTRPLPRAPRRLGNVTIRVHQDGVPKPVGFDRVTVSDFTPPYQPSAKGKGRPAASYRAARRNAARAYRRHFLNVSS